MIIFLKMSRSSIATQEPILADDDIPAGINLNDTISKAIGANLDKPIYIGSIIITKDNKKKKPKTEKEILEHIIEKKPPSNKVRKFFTKYANRITYEEEVAGMDCLSSLQG